MITGCDPETEGYLATVLVISCVILFGKILLDSFISKVEEDDQE